MHGDMPAGCSQVVRNGMPDPKTVLPILMIHNHFLESSTI